MSAFFIATAVIKDAEKFQQYAGKVRPTLAPFGGELVIRGMAGETLTGTSNHHGVGVVRFADMEALNAWYRSPDYQALISLREGAADMTLVTYTEAA